VVEVAPENRVAFEEAMAGHVCARIGTVTGDSRLRMTGLGGRKVVDVGVGQLRAAWQALNAQTLRRTANGATIS